MPLIRCDADGLVPGCIICCHLQDGSSPWADAVAIDNGPGEQLDWLCLACHQLFPTLDDDALQAATAERLRTACVFCVRKLREHEEDSSDAE